MGTDCSSEVTRCGGSTVYFIEIAVFKANSVDTDQTLQNTQHDLGLHCLPMSFLWDAGINKLTQHLYPKINPLPWNYFL